MLRGYAARDEGAARLGEVALVDGEGRIGALDTVFFDTLLDENAASHIALGRAYSLCLDGEDDRARINQTEIHVDFMIGSDEMHVTGLTGAGERVPVLAERRLGALSGHAGLCAPGAAATLRRPPSVPGEVPERLNGHDWKSCDGG